MPGDRIMFVNSSQLQHASLDTAVQVEQQDGNERMIIIKTYKQETLFSVFFSVESTVWRSNVELLHRIYSHNDNPEMFKNNT